MNGKKARKLRQEAQAEIIGMDAVGYAAKRISKGLGKGTSVQIVLIPNCTRAVYKAKKRDA